MPDRTLDFLKKKNYKSLASGVTLSCGVTIDVIKSIAITTTTKVPTTALPMPPPSMPAPGVSSVNKLGLSRAAPFTSSMYSTENSGNIAIRLNTKASTVRPVFTNVRGSLFD